MSEEATTTVQSEPKKNPVQAFMDRIKRMEDEGKGEDVDLKDLVLYDMLPSMVQLANLWHGTQVWQGGFNRERDIALAAMAAEISEIKASLVSLSQQTEDLSEQMAADDSVAYDTQYTEEDAEELRQFVLASLNIISQAVQDAEIKRALTLRGQEILQKITDNTLNPQEEDDDVDPDS